MKYVVYILAVIGLLAMLVVGYWGFTYYQFYNDLENGIYSLNESDEYFDKLIFFSGAIDPYQDYPDMPSGKAEIFGEITINGEPLPGLDVSVIFAEKYKATVVSGEDGRFSFSVPEGEWIINSIRLTSWQDKPAGNFVVLSGDEGRLEGNQYRFDLVKPFSNRKINAKDGESKQFVELEVQPAVKLIEPSEDDNTVIEEADNYDIKWDRQPNSTQYWVQLSRVEQKGAGTTHIAVSAKLTRDSKLPLSDFILVPDQGKTNTYSVEVLSFDEGGLYVSSSSNYTSNTFDLVGFKIVRDDTIATVGSNVSGDRYTEYEKNNERIDAVKLLVAEGLLSEAEILLERITANSRPGKKIALKGYIQAELGNCDAAREYFEQAQSVGEKACVPDYYWADCEM